MPSAHTMSLEYDRMAKVERRKATEARSVGQYSMAAMHNSRAVVREQAKVILETMAKKDHHDDISQLPERAA